MCCNGGQASPCAISGRLRSRPAHGVNIGHDMIARARSKRCKPGPWAGCPCHPHNSHGIGGLKKSGPSLSCQKTGHWGILILGNAADNRFVFAIDESDKSPWFGYFDRNNNGDLTDDGPPVIISANVEFDVAVVLSNGKTVRRPYKIWQWPNNQSSNPCIRFYSVCHHQTKLHLNGETITAVAFEQYNHDALYRDDGIWLDLNGDNRMDEKTELFKDGSTVTAKGRAFQVKLDYP